MAFKIYTKTGDKGKTGLIGGTRVPKYDPRINACGDLDELNAYIGLVADLIHSENGEDDLLRKIQSDLFIIGAWLTFDQERNNHPNMPHLEDSKILELESAIDTMESALEPMTHFILPGGHIIVSHIHIARSICRRAERSIVLVIEEITIENQMSILSYINRLSDYLFVLSRFIAKKLHIQEIKWIPNV